MCVPPVRVKLRVSTYASQSSQSNAPLVSDDQRLRRVVCLINPVLVRALNGHPKDMLNMLQEVR